jgi:hypothetical protein
MIRGVKVSARARFRVRVKFRVRITVARQVIVAEEAGNRGRIRIRT